MTPTTQGIEKCSLLSQVLQKRVYSRAEHFRFKKARVLSCKTVVHPCSKMTKASLGTWKITTPCSQGPFLKGNRVLPWGAAARLRLLDRLQ